MIKKYFLGFFLIILSIACMQNVVSAFATFNKFGGAIHQNISTSALLQVGISEASFQVIDDGNTSQDHIGTKKFETASHHFDNNHLANGVKYTKKQLALAIISAVEADKDKSAWQETLYTFGELLHPVQDFYSHTNYVELKLSANPALKPEDIPLPNWDDLTGLAPSRSGLKSGYFFYKNAGNNELTNVRRISAKMIKLEFPGTNFLSDKKYAEAIKDYDHYLKYAAAAPIDVLHRDLNKDESGSSAGKMINPNTGKSLFDYAFNLAVRESIRQWQRLEDGIKEKYPDRAKRIILSLKKGIGQVKIVKGPLLEAISVPADKPEPVNTNSILNKDEYYVIDVSGTYSCWDDKTDGVDAYYLYSHSWREVPKPEAWKHLLLDDLSMFDTAEQNGDITDYHADHFYSTYITGKGNSLKLQIADAINSSGDNHGGLEVKIYRGLVQ
ncbi:hypothetical protein HZB07_01635 [Candidatus Saganbacteria bacterium]|nr:hypothetical protein [Candidatus Saganbacteria bacterium]